MILLSFNQIISKVNLKIEIVSPIVQGQIMIFFFFLKRVKKY